MDDKWFKLRQKKVGVTAEDIAARLGRDRSVVSRIYTGRQKMSFEWAQIFADVLEVPLADVLEHAGVADAQTARRAAPGFTDGDAAPWTPKRDDETASTIAQHLGGERPGIEIWQVNGSALALQGYLPGDMILVDTHQSETCRPGDAVVAQIYDWTTSTATTVLRIFQPPVLISTATPPEAFQVHVVDGNNVVIKGKIVASWRSQDNIRPN